MISEVQDALCKSKAKKKLSKLIKKNMWKLYDEKKRINYADKSIIEKYQLSKLKVLFTKAYKTPYYKKIIDSLGKPINEVVLKDLKKFPILTKDIIEQQAGNLIIQNPAVLHRNSIEGPTGGTINIYQDQNYKDHAWASRLIRNELSGWFYGACCIRLLSKQKDKQYFSKKLDHFWHNTQLYDASPLSENKLNEFHRMMTARVPEFIIAHTSSIYLLAAYLNSKGIIPNYPKLSISTTSETLYPYMRKTIEETFNVKCFDHYGSREIEEIAGECRKHNGLHVFMDNVIVECLDPETGEEAYDRPGKLIITDLNNHGMPFIRYEIGDTCTLTKENCSCGMSTPLIKEIFKNSTANVVLENGNHINGWMLSKALFPLEGIKSYQFVQETFNSYTLNILKMDCFNINSLNDPLNKMKKILGETASIEIKFVEAIPDSSPGHREYIISKINPEAAGQKKEKTLISRSTKMITRV